MRLFGIAALAALIASPALADPCEAPLPKPGTEFSGVVSYIVDGDGLCVGQDQGGIEVRLADFNAPELNAPGGQAAKAMLRKLIFGKTVSCIAGKRCYDRTVARCFLSHQRTARALGDLMREAGIEEGGR